MHDQKANCSLVLLLFELSRYQKQSLHNQITLKSEQFTCHHMFYTRFKSWTISCCYCHILDPMRYEESLTTLTFIGIEYRNGIGMQKLIDLLFVCDNRMPLNGGRKWGNGLRGTGGKQRKAQNFNPKFERKSMMRRKAFPQTTQR